MSWMQRSDLRAIGPPVTSLASLRNNRATSPWCKSRLLHSGASAAPCSDSPSLAAPFGMVALFTNSASCLVSGATPAKHQQVLRSFNPPTTNKANTALLAVGLDHPCASPQGEVRAVPSNITRHYAKWPHARSSLVNAATSHNAELCVNGPEGMPPKPPPGAYRWLRVLSDPPPNPSSQLKVAPATQKACVFRSAL